MIKLGILGVLLIGILGILSFDYFNTTNDESFRSFHSLTMDFNYDEKLEMELCNDSKRSVSFFDGVGFGDGHDSLFSSLASVYYKTQDGHTHTVNHPFFSPIGGDFYTPTVEKTIASGECLKKHIDIKRDLENRSDELIDTFRIDISFYKVFKMDSLKPGNDLRSRFFESPWFSLYNKQSKESGDNEQHDK